MTVEPRPTFKRELESLINRYSLENGSNTPDFILARYLSNCLVAFDSAVRERTRWFGPEGKPLSIDPEGWPIPIHGCSKAPDSTWELIEPGKSCPYCGGELT